MIPIGTHNGGGDTVTVDMVVERDAGVVDEVKRWGLINHALDSLSKS
jgi:hypothetical protein